MEKRFEKTLFCSQVLPISVLLKAMNSRLFEANVNTKNSIVMRETTNFL